MKNSEGDDIAPAKERKLDCAGCKNLQDDKPPDSISVMPSASYVQQLFFPEIKNDEETKERLKNRPDISQYLMNSNNNVDAGKISAVNNMTANVESLHFTGSNTGFASFSHPPSYEYLASNYLPFEKSVPKGGTDLFFFGMNNNKLIRFTELNNINSPYWDSHPTAITHTNSKGQNVTLLIFSSDRAEPFSKAITMAGDTISGGSTDLYYSFGIFDPTEIIDTLNIKGFNWTVPVPLEIANTKVYNEGSPFVYCQCCNPTLFFSSNRKNSNLNEYDIYSVKLEIDFDNLNLDVLNSPELIDTKSQITDSSTLAINTIADERFPFVPFPHKEKAGDNFLYFSSDRNKKPVERQCDCEYGNDRTENIGGYDIYRYVLPEKFNCPQPKEPEKPVVYEPELYAEIVLLDANEPDKPVKNPIIYLKDEKGQIITSENNSGKLSFKLDFGKSYSASGGSSYNTMDCQSSDEIIFRGYSAAQSTFHETERDSSVRVDTISGFSIKASEFLKLKTESKRNSQGKISIKDILVPDDSLFTEKLINAKIEKDKVYYDKQITTIIYWNNIDVRPDFSKGYEEIDIHSTLTGSALSVRTLNKNLSAQKPKSNEKIVLRDTIFLLPDYIIKPPCYCEFSGVLTPYQQNVPYFQTGFWEVNTIGNYNRHLRMLESGKFSEAKWIELHKNNQYFGEGMKYRWSRFIEYENYARVVDSNLSKIAELIVGNIIPAFKIIDSITPGSKLIISLDAWSDRRPVTRGWYIGDEVNYVEGSLNEGIREYDVDFKKVVIPDKSSLNLNNDTLSRLRAYYGYKELLAKLLDTAKVGRGFYDYFIAGQSLLPDDSKLTSSNLNLPFSLKNVEELIYKSKIIILAKGNYYDSTQYKIPGYIKGVDSSLFMLDTIRRIDVRINTLQYEAGKLIKSPCCNPLLPCVDYSTLRNIRNAKDAINTEERKKKKK